ncbi:class F sortase, partial [Jiangella anatolica]
AEPAEGRAGPRHRRPRPAKLPWLLAPLLLVPPAWWGIAQMDGPSDDPPAVASPGYDPAEQSAVPGQPVGAAEGLRRYTLRLPDLEAPVIAITSTADRVLLPPKDPLLAGWWRDGAAPGAEAGAAVVVGHAVEGGEAAFNSVVGLEPGDEVRVSGSGVEQRYRVDTVETMAPGDLPARADELFAQDVPGRLVLVTCADWDGTAFRSNVVVTAVPV